MERTQLPHVLQIFYVFFFFLDFTSCTLDISMRVGKRGPFTYGNFLKRINGSVLRVNDSLISKLEVDNEIDCASSCVMNEKCLSVNFGVEKYKPGKVQCELLNFGASDFQKYLVKKELFFFMRMETVCSSNPCEKEYHVCTPKLKDSKNTKPYSCNCSNTCTGDRKCQALGMEDKVILDSQISASSELDNNWLAISGRLHSPRGWIPSHIEAVSRNGSLKINLLRRTLINGVSTQGRSRYNQYTKTYQLSYSDDGELWILYNEKGIPKTFNGNVDYEGIVKNLLMEPFVAKMVRIHPKYYHGRPALRMELYGCHI